MKKGHQKKYSVLMVREMHCAACERVVENKLLEFREILSCRASFKKGQVQIEWSKNMKPLSLNKLNHDFQSFGYLFSEVNEPQSQIFSPKLVISLTAGGSLLAALFVILEPVSQKLEPGLGSSLVLGILAGFSSCAALTGSILLALTEKWRTEARKGSPYLIFLLGRIFSYFLFGAVLGLIGSKIRLSSTLSLILVLAVSTFMIITAFQMLGFSFAKKMSFSFSFRKHQKSKISELFPFLSGFFTFFLPCGFTLTVQGMSLVSGNPLKASLLMGFFAIGTLPGLFFIGIFSKKMFQSKSIQPYFSKAAAVILIFFALFQIKNQMNVMDFSLFEKNAESLKIGSSSRISPKILNPLTQNENSQLAPLVNGRQILKMEVSAYGYSPNFFKVRQNIPVRFEIMDRGASGCTNAVIAPSFFEGEIALSRGKTSVKEFTPRQKGFFRFTCWMGMVSGTIQVVENAQG